MSEDGGNDWDVAEELEISSDDEYYDAIVDDYFVPPSRGLLIKGNKYKYIKIQVVSFQTKIYNAFTQESQHKIIGAQTHNLLSITL